MASWGPVRPLRALKKRSVGPVLFRPRLHGKKTRNPSERSRATYVNAAGGRLRRDCMGRSALREAPAGSAVDVLCPGDRHSCRGGSLKKWVLGFSFMRLQVRARGTAGGRWAAGLGESSQPARS
jgi:hypothetical protein